MAAGRLVVCPTPIGNLEDVTLRVLGALREADVIACEDTRHTRVLLERHGVSASTISYHEHNESERAQQLIQRMVSGETVALVSDAGTPLVSDPGFVLVQMCIAAGLAVEVLPGASAPLTAVVASGLPSDVWRFAGFLPRRKKALYQLFASTAETLVAFESPNRVGASLRVLAELDPQRPAAVCRELTKLADRFEGERVRGEIVLVIGAAAAGEADRVHALEAVQRLIAAGAKPRTAAAVVADLTGVAANELYAELTK